MKNTAVASIEFYFKGEQHTPSVRVDLDALVEQDLGLDSLYHVIAAAGGFDTYSYEYEVMQAEEIRFSEAEGLVADFIHDGVLDLDGFKTQRQEGRVLDQLRAIAGRYLGSDDLDGQPGLRQALLEAFRLGRQG